MIQQAKTRLIIVVDPQLVLVEHLPSASNPLNPSVLIHKIVRYLE